MNPSHRPEHVGLGTYSPAEASRLTQVSAQRVRRWRLGYESQSGSGRRKHRPVWHGEFRSGPDGLELGFRDLMELRALSAFIQKGVSWKVLRQAHDRAEELVGHPFPFSTNKFCTDGRKVFADLEYLGADPGLAEIISGQGYFEAILRPLIVQIDFGADHLPSRWWPLGKRHRVVVDPERGFGRPIVRDEGVPTSVLAQAVRAGDSLSMVARWFEVDRPALRDALKFEAQFAA